MVAFNFKEQFANLVEAGIKRNTIRQSRRCKPSDILQLYTGMRTKKCRKLGEGICTFVEPITIYRTHLQWGHSDDSIIENDRNIGSLNEYAKDDGFPDWESLCDFFQKQYGLPFKGFVHTWKPAPPTGTANEI